MMNERQAVFYPLFTQCTTSPLLQRGDESHIAYHSSFIIPQFFFIPLKLRSES